MLDNKLILGFNMDVRNSPTIIQTQSQEINKSTLQPTTSSSSSSSSSSCSVTTTGKTAPLANARSVERLDTHRELQRPPSDTKLTQLAENIDNKATSTMSKTNKPEKSAKGFTSKIFKGMSQKLTHVFKNKGKDHQVDSQPNSEPIITGMDRAKEAVRAEKREIKGKEPEVEDTDPQVDAEPDSEPITGMDRAKAAVLAERRALKGKEPEEEEAKPVDNAKQPANAGKVEDRGAILAKMSTRERKNFLKAEAETIEADNKLLNAQNNPTNHVYQKLNTLLNTHRNDKDGGYADTSKLFAAIKADPELSKFIKTDNFDNFMKSIVSFVENDKNTNGDLYLNSHNEATDKTNIITGKLYSTPLIKAHMDDSKYLKMYVNYELRGHTSQLKTTLGFTTNERTKQNLKNLYQLNIWGHDDSLVEAHRDLTKQLISNYKTTQEILKNPTSLSKHIKKDESHDATVKNWNDSVNSNDFSEISAIITTQVCNDAVQATKKLNGFILAYVDSLGTPKDMIDDVKAEFPEHGTPDYDKVNEKLETLIKAKIKENEQRFG